MKLLLTLTMAFSFSITAIAKNGASPSKYGTYSFLSLDQLDVQKADDIVLSELVISETGVSIHFAEEQLTYPNTRVLSNSNNTNLDQRVLRFVQNPKTANVLWLNKKVGDSIPEMFIDFDFSNSDLTNVNAIIVDLNGPFGPLPVGFILKSTDNLQVLETILTINN